MRLLDNIKTRAKLIGGFVTVAALIVLVAVIALINLSKINADMGDMYETNLIPINQIGIINTEFANIRGDIYRYMVVEGVRDVTLQTIRDRRATIDSTMGEIKKLQHSIQEEALIAQSEKAKASIDSRLIAAYDRLRSNAKNGLAVVGVDRDSCGGCFNKIPPQRQLDIDTRRKVIVCEHCGRILVPAEVVDAE